MGKGDGWAQEPWARATSESSGLLALGGRGDANTSVRRLRELEGFNSNCR